MVSADCEPGAITTVRDERGTFVGKAFYSSKSQIALRFLSRSDTAIDAAFFRKRFADASALRVRLGVDPLSSRRIFAEGDYLPGLIVDRYGDILVLQSLIQGTDRLEPLVVGLLEEEYAPRSILVRNDNKIRELEGLALRREVIGGQDPCRAWPPPPAGPTARLLRIFPPWRDARRRASARRAAPAAAARPRPLSRRFAWTD
jgi:23S rRNA (cytosine1962-C5)-methyltransferase